MKTTKPLIIRLFKAVMEHKQLVVGHHRLGFESNLHGTDLSAVVAGLMHIREMNMN